MASFVLFTLLLALPAYAADKKDSLREIESQVAAEKAKQIALDSQVRDLENGMKGLKTDLVKTADRVQQNEARTGDLEEKLETLARRKQSVTDDLDKDRKALADLIIALERIRRLPPEALIARPGAPLETARAAIVLGAIMPDLNRRADSFRAKLDELQSLEDDLVVNRRKLLTSAEDLKKSRDKMEKLIVERKDAMDKAKVDYEIQQQQVAALSRKAGDLKDLIAKIDAERLKRLKTREKPVEGKKRRKQVDESQLGDSLAALGGARLPVRGNIAIKYGQPDDLGAASEGLHIKSRPGAVVVAPMSGVVRYAGPFKSYGSIVLIEHKNNYHSLIAGLGRIDTVAGQSVDAGEPLGTLLGKPGPTPSLYYELRFNGQPINPARKFANLG